MAPGVATPPLLPRALEKGIHAPHASADHTPAFSGRSESLDWSIFLYTAILPTQYILIHPSPHILYNNASAIELVVTTLEWDSTVTIIYQEHIPLEKLHLPHA